jgi:agmatine deiminase
LNLKTKNRTPAELGYHMPAEWERHSATQLHWPHNRSTWPGKSLDAVERVYLEIIAALTRSEPVYVFAANDRIQQRAQKLLDRSNLSIDFKNLRWIIRPINDIWARDCGPIFVRKTDDSDDVAITDWEYNAWGGKYPPFDDDNRLPEFISNEFELPRYTAGMVLEGGSIEVNGVGDLLTTESVLLNPNRNPELSKSDIEKKLYDYLGAQNIIWLGEGLQGDDTDGHIDDLARFLNPQTILTVRTKESDPNYTVLEENYERLCSARSVTGASFAIETLPLPQTQTSIPTVDGSEYVPASYANFYIANQAVLVPLYDDKTDGQALELFRHYFPDRDIVGIPCGDLVWGQGSIHCITQQWYGISEASFGN